MKAFVVSLLLICLSGLLIQAANGQTGPAISNIQVSGVTPTSAEITWSTDVPATSQVILMDTLYNASLRFPEPRDPTLTTAHIVVLSDLLPNTSYTYYLASQDSDGRLATTYDVNNPAKFATAPIDPNAPFDYRLDATGPANVYAGHDLYLSFYTVVLSGPNLRHIYFNSIEGLPAGAVARPRCFSLRDPTPLNEDGGYFVSPDKRPYCYNGADKDIYRRKDYLRVQIPADTAPGAYTLTVNIEIRGLQRQFKHGFNVLAPPAPVARAPVAEIPPIPGLKKWEDTMLFLAAKYCNPNEVMSFGYESQVWYYDGGRVFFQIADYTKDPDRWNPCALNIIKQYRDYVISAGGSVTGWRVFPHGLAMNYWRSGDDLSRQAAVLLTTGSPYAQSGGNVVSTILGDMGIRETAYIINAYVTAEQLGQPRSPYLARAVDFALGHFDQLFVSKPWRFDQIFFDGIMAEALINYYELTGDPRIPPAIRSMLDWLWDNAYSPKKHALAYNPLRVPPSYTTVQSNLVIPAFAWYWQLTGNDTYRVRGDDLFEHALDEDISYSGKIFSQNYKWSFDYVRRRSSREMAYSTVHPENNTPDYVRGGQNRAPVVDAGVNQTLAWPAGTVSLSGTAVDPDGDSLTYSWSKLDGFGTVQFSQPDSLSTSATFSGPGRYVLQLTAADRYVSASDTVVVTIGGGWYDGAWSYRKAITVNPSRVLANLGDFPLLVSIADADLRAAGNGGKVASAEGQDLVFTDAASERLPFEIEKYDPTSGELVAWVRTDLSPSLATVIYLYFGNPAAAAAPGTNSVWDDGYRGVWHLGALSGGKYRDSTGNGNDGSSEIAPSPVAGMAGESWEFRAGSMISLPASASLQFGTDMTVEGWVNMRGQVGYPVGRSIFYQPPLTSGGYPLFDLKVTNQFDIQCRVRAWSSLPATAATDKGALSLDQWFHIAFVRSGSGATNQIYINGVPAPLVASAGLTTSTAPGPAPAVIGYGSVLPADLDEVRVSSVARSAEWTQTGYNNQSSPSTFAVLGPTETVVPEAPINDEPTCPLGRRCRELGTKGARPVTLPRR
jgi:hypothetical protein